MRPKHKALLFNFIGFAVLFIIARLALGYFIDINRIFLAVGAAIIANILAPKFGAIDRAGKQRVLMKWIFLKGFREI
ncbi:MAG: hypothetical protein WBN39_14190 [Flavobacteriaceae bacterium]